MVFKKIEEEQEKKLTVQIIEEAINEQKATALKLWTISCCTHSSFDRQSYEAA